MRLKIVYLLAIVSVVWFGGCANKEVTWIGHPMVSDNDEYTPSQGWLPNYIIGFRNDGQVMWKEADD